MPTNEDLNLVVARWLAAHGHPELAWESNYLICANGHVVTSAEDVALYMGTPCSRCGEPLGPKPLDFSQPAPLLAAVEAWRNAHGGEYTWSIDSAGVTDDGESYGPSAYVAPSGRVYGSWDDSPWLALRAALAAAIEAEKGESHAESLPRL